MTIVNRVPNIRMADDVLTMLDTNRDKGVTAAELDVGLRQGKARINEDGVVVRSAAPRQAPVVVSLVSTAPAPPPSPPLQTPSAPAPPVATPSPAPVAPATPERAPDGDPQLTQHWIDRLDQAGNDDDDIAESLVRDAGLMANLGGAAYARILDALGTGWVTDGEARAGHTVIQLATRYGRAGKMVDTLAQNIRHLRDILASDDLRLPLLGAAVSASPPPATTNLRLLLDQAFQSRYHDGYLAGLTYLLSWPNLQPEAREILAAISQRVR